MNEVSDVQIAKIEALIDHDSAGIWPILEYCGAVSGSVQLRCRLPDELKWFDGHFDQAPVLPGVVQTHWAGMLAQTAFSLEYGFHQLRAVKFHRLLHPGATIELVLSQQGSLAEDDGTRVHFAFKEHSDGQIWPVSEGKLSFSGGS